jgi:hypothetical protein
MTEEPNTINLHVTFPEGLPSGVRVGVKRPDATEYTYITQTSTVEIPQNYAFDCILEFPDTIEFDEWTIGGGSFVEGFTYHSNPTRVMYTDDYGTLTFKVIFHTDYRIKLTVENPTGFSGNGMRYKVSGQSEELILDETYRTMDKGTQFTLYSHPTGGCVFDKWRCYITPAQYIDVTGNIFNTYFGDRDITEYRAIFKKSESKTPIKLAINADNVTINYKVDGGAYQPISTGTTVYVEPGSTVSFLPDSSTYPQGRTFDHWMKGTERITTEELTFVAEGTALINLGFYCKSSTGTHPVNINFAQSSLGNGSVQYTIGSQQSVVVSGNTSINVDNRVTLKLKSVNRKPKYYVDKWTVTDSTGTRDIIGDEEITLTIISQTSITYYLKRKYTITVRQATGGTISPGTSEYDAHSTAHFTITPNPHFKIESLIVDDVTQSPSSTKDFVDITQDHTLSASYTEKQKCRVVASAGAGGSIDPPGTSYIYEDESALYTITPDSGFIIEDVIIDNVSQGAITSISLYYQASGHTISASFKRDKTKYTINVQSTGHGRIVASATEVYEGDSVTITCTPDEDWYLSDIVDNGKHVGAKNPYIISNVRENHTVVASFEHTATVKTTIFIKIDGAWQIINLELYPQMYVKINGVWNALFTEYDAPMIYTKENGIWVKLFKEVNSSLL